jgi:hypothetical protein
MVLKSLLACDRRPAALSPRDGLVGAGVIVGVTLVFTAALMAARAGGWTAAAHGLQIVSFPGALVLSMPFWLMKDQPWKAQVAIVAGTMLVLIAIGLGAAALTSR